MNLKEEKTVGGDPSAHWYYISKGRAIKSLLGGSLIDPKASRLKPAPAWLNEALVAAHDIERLALFPFNRIAGVTAFCLARKPELAQSKQAA